MRAPTGLSSLYHHLIHLFEHLGIAEYPASELLSKEVSEFNIPGLYSAWLVWCLLLLSLWLTIVKQGKWYFLCLERADLLGMRCMDDVCEIVFGL